MGSRGVDLGSGRENSVGGTLVGRWTLMLESIGALRDGARATDVEGGQDVGTTSVIFQKERAFTQKSPGNSRAWILNPGVHTLFLRSSP